jgi:hypothetical protein
MLGSGIIYLFIMRISVYGLVLRPLILKKKVSSNMMIVGRLKSDLEEHSDWLIANRTLGFTIASRLVCTEITSSWIEEFDRLVRYQKITEVLMLPGMESDPNFSKFIHYCEDLDIHVNWIPLDSGNLGYWLIPSPQEGIPFLTYFSSLARSQALFRSRLRHLSHDSLEPCLYRYSHRGAYLQWVANFLLTKESGLKWEDL